MKNKRGWIRIVEAFVAILLIAGVLLIVLNKGYLSKDNSAEVYEKELTVLRAIQTDDLLRAKLLAVELSESNPSIGWENSAFPEEIKERITSSMGESLDCTAMICSLKEICVLESYTAQNIYSRAIAITANLTSYNPKQLKLFCSIKE